MSHDPYKSPEAQVISQGSREPQNFLSLHIALTICFLSLTAPVVGLVENYLSPENPIYIYIMFAGAISYYIVLGVLAAKKKRSVVLWVGLTFLGTPFGFLVSYIMMLFAKPKTKR